MPGGTFKMLPGTGPHTEKDGQTYGPGDTFDSPDDLDRINANKFERVGGKTKRPRDRDDSLDNSGAVMDDPHHQLVKKGRMKGKMSEEDADQLPRGFSAKNKDGMRVRGEREEDTDDDHPAMLRKGDKAKKAATEAEEEKPRKKKKKGLKSKKKAKKVRTESEEVTDLEDKKAEDGEGSD